MITMISITTNLFNIRVTLLPFPLVLLLSTYSCWSRASLLHPITPNDTNTIGRTPLDEGSVRSRNLYRTTHNINKKEREVSMLPAGFEPAIPQASSYRYTT